MKMFVGYFQLCVKKPLCSTEHLGRHLGTDSYTVAVVEANEGLLHEHERTADTHLMSCFHVLSQ